MNADIVMQYVQAVPQWVVIWLAVLAVMNTLSVFFLRHRVGWVVLLCWLIILGVSAWLVMQQGGITRVVAWTHLIWVPMIIILGLMARRPSETRLVNVWLHVVVLCNCVSLAFDTVEIVRWIGGARGIIGA